MMKSEIKALGQTITKDLNLEDDYDVLNKWMITYIAEQMHRYETAKTEEEKEIAGEKCSDTIMKFWMHRHSNPSWNPLEKYDELLKTLNNIIERKHGASFINFIESRTATDDSLKDRSNKIREVASWLIEDLFLEAYGEVRDPDDNRLIDLVDDLRAPDGAIIRLVSGIYDGRDGMLKEYIVDRVDQIEYVIGMLDEFVKKERVKLESES